MYLPYFPQDRPGQLVTSLPDNDIKEILYHISMAELFKSRMEKLEKLIPPSVPSRNNKKSRKGLKKRKSVTFDNSRMKIQIKDIQERNFANTTVHVDIPWINAPRSRHCQINKTEKEQLF